MTESREVREKAKAKAEGRGRRDHVWVHRKGFKYGRGKIICAIQ